MTAGSVCVVHAIARRARERMVDVVAHVHARAAEVAWACKRACQHEPSEGASQLGPDADAQWPAAR
jgi:hypothetical protein